MYYGWREDIERLKFMEIDLTSNILRLTEERQKIKFIRLIKINQDSIYKNMGV
jgi:hypothetical protein